MQGTCQVECKSLFVVRNVNKTHLYLIIDAFWISSSSDFGSGLFPSRTLFLVCNVWFPYSTCLLWVCVTFCFVFRLTFWPLHVKNTNTPCLNFHILWCVINSVTLFSSINLLTDLSCIISFLIKSIFTSLLLFSHCLWHCKQQKKHFFHRIRPHTIVIITDVKKYIITIIIHDLKFLTRLWHFHSLIFWSNMHTGAISTIPWSQLPVWLLLI